MTRGFDWISAGCPRRSSRHIEHRDALRDTHHHPHLVLDEEDRDPELVAQVADEVGQLRRFRRVHSAVGSSRRSRRGLRERPADLEPALVAIGQLAREQVALAAQADVTQQAAGLILGLFSSCLTDFVPSTVPDPGRRGGGAGRPGCSPWRSCSRRAGCSGTFAKRRGVRSGRGGACGSVAVELDLARGDVVEPRDAVEERRLPGAVRSDDADDGSFVDIEVELVDGEEPAEPLGDGAGTRSVTTSRPA